MTDCIAIVSGGMDSVTLLHYLVKREARRPAVITYRYGQKHDKEVALAAWQARQLGLDQHLVLDLAAMAPVFTGSALTDAAIAVPAASEVTGDPQPITYVPNRNMVFLALAVAYAEAQGVDTVYYGAQRHDLYGYWDTTPEFLAALNDVYALNRKSKITIAAPFVAFAKGDLLKIGLELGVDYSQTWSCYEGGAAACGRCPTCAERRQAFAEAGLTDPIPYEAV